MINLEIISIISPQYTNKPQTKLRHSTHHVLLLIS